MTTLSERRGVNISNIDLNLYIDTDEITYNNNLINPSIILEKNSKIKDDCPICLDTMLNKNVVYTPCCHIMHAECLNQQFKSNCKSKYKCCICRYDLLIHIPRHKDYRSSVLSPLPYVLSPSVFRTFDF